MVVVAVAAAVVVVVVVVVAAGGVCHCGFAVLSQKRLREALRRTRTSQTGSARAEPPANTLAKSQGAAQVRPLSAISMPARL